ncbi:hypothetical protein [Thiocapsa sp.]|nr:hypothetical protein [Thiocapsa sp.]HSO81136.1 hypothetical protein [Thiocapsa sp.]
MLSRDDGGTSRRRDPGLGRWEMVGRFTERDLLNRLVAKVFSLPASRCLP